MTFSPDWNPRVQNSIDCNTVYRHLFEPETTLLLCPLDGIRIGSEELSDEFHRMLKAHAYRKRFDQEKANDVGYATSLSLGCVTVLTDPVYPGAAKYKVIINPSTAGMSVGQLVAWVEFMFDDPDRAIYRGHDSKEDLKNVSQLDVAHRIWVNYIRKAPNRRYELDGTTYYGSRDSGRQVCVYDKEKQLREKKGRHLGHALTRIEERYKAPKGKRIPIMKFLADLHKLTAFDQVFLIDTDQFYVNTMILQHKGDAQAPVQEALKALTPYHRGKVLKALRGNGNMHCLAPEFKKDLQAWLAASAGTNPVPTATTVRAKRAKTRQSTAKSLWRTHECIYATGISKPAYGLPRERRVPAVEFLAYLNTLTAFDQAFLIDTVQFYLQTATQHGGIVQGLHVQEEIQSIPDRRRRPKAVKALKANGNMHSMQPEFKKQLQAWLSATTGTNAALASICVSNQSTATQHGTVKSLHRSHECTCGNGLSKRKLIPSPHMLLRVLAPVHGPPAKPLRQCRGTMGGFLVSTPSRSPPHLGAYGRLLQWQWARKQAHGISMSPAGP